MAKWVSAAVLDTALNAIGTADRMLAIAGQASSYPAALAQSLAEVSVGGTDFSLAVGDISGRKLVVAPRAGVPVTREGVADHVALVDSTGGQLLYVTTCPTQTLPAGGQVDFGGWSVEIGDPL